MSVACERGNGPFSVAVGVGGWDSNQQESKAVAWTDSI